MGSGRAPRRAVSVACVSADAVEIRGGGNQLMCVCEGVRQELHANHRSSLFTLSLFSLKETTTTKTEVKKGEREREWSSVCVKQRG